MTKSIANSYLSLVAFLAIIAYGFPSEAKSLQNFVDDKIYCSEDGKFPHPEYCEQYYECKDGVQSEVKHCLEEYNRLFDIEHMECNYDVLVHCYDRIRPPWANPTIQPLPSTTPTSSPSPSTSTNVTTEVPSTSTNPSDSYNCTENGAFPHPKYCEMYYDCWEGLATLLRCPQDQLFEVNQEYQGCAPEAVVDCGERLPPGNFTCPPDSDGQKFPDPTSCSSYYVCDNGDAKRLSCPDGLYFNPNLQVCDYPENVICNSENDKSQAKSVPKFKQWLNWWI